MTGAVQWLEAPAAQPDHAAGRAARQRQGELTKPQGALGALESAAIQLAALQRTPLPRLDNLHIAVFAGDHGVAREGVSAFPQPVTAEMIRNFSRGGAAISVLAKELGASLEVINLGTVQQLGPVAGIVTERLGPGTADLSRDAAMTPHQFIQALSAGRHAAERARMADAHLFIGGEMGIGNSTAAAALCCALLGADPSALTGPGTGLDPAGVTRKTRVIARALALHHAHARSPLEALRRLSGFEIAALTGAYIACAHMGLPVLVDGFIASAAALAAVQLNPTVRPWLLFAHNSAEPGHARVLEALAAEPLLSLNMRLGEGSGAAVAVPILRLACALHNRMATFAEADVSTCAS